MEVALGCLGACRLSLPPGFCPVLFPPWGRLIPVGQWQPRWRPSSAFPARLCRRHRGPWAPLERCSGPLAGFHNVTPKTPAPVLGPSRTRRRPGSALLATRGGCLWPSPAGISRRRTGAPDWRPVGRGEPHELVADWAVTMLLLLYCTALTVCVRPLAAAWFSSACRVERVEEVACWGQRCWILSSRHARSGVIN